MNKQEILLDIKAHQNDINRCIGDLVEARIFPNKAKELNAYARMESLLAKTNQMCSVIIDFINSLPEDSHGKDLLYVCDKTAEITRKRTIDEAYKWLEHNTPIGLMQEEISDFLEDFRKVMEE